MFQNIQMDSSFFTKDFSKLSYKSSFLDYSQILFFESIKNYCLVNFADGTIIKVASNLGKYNDSPFLPAYFKRVHKSYLVNTNHIKKVSDDNLRIYMINNTVIPINSSKLSHNDYKKYKFHSTKK